MILPRYWKITQTAITINHAPRTCEYAWIDGNTTVTPVSFNYGGTISFNAEQIAYAFDGLTNTTDTGWITGNTGYIRADFGTAGRWFTSFSAFSSYGGGARGATYELSYSFDDVNYTVVKTWNYETTTPFTGWFSTTISDNPFPNPSFKIPKLRPAPFRPGYAR